MRRWRLVGPRSTAGAARDCLKYDRNNPDVIKPQYVVETLWNMTGGRRRLHHVRRRASTRCGRRSTYRSTNPRRWINSGGLGTMGVGIPYAMGIKLAKPQRSVLHHRRRLGADEHPGTVHLPAVQHADQDRLAEQPLPGHGAPVAGDRILGPLQPQLHGRAAQLRETGRGLWPRGHADRAPRRTWSPRCAKPASSGPHVFMDFRTDPTENVFPMVQAGKGITEMLLSGRKIWYEIRRSPRRCS